MPKASPLKIKVVQSDISTLKVDVVVNAANTSLTGGRGVNGSIHRKAGPALLNTCRTIRSQQFPMGVPVGEAILTDAYNLPAKHVVHAVSPVYLEERETDPLMLACIKKTLVLAEQQQAKSIAFPALSTGSFKYPKKACAELLKKAIQEHQQEHVKEVTMCMFSKEDKDVFSSVFK